MPWKYSQSSGWLSRGGKNFEKGYSGRGVGKNNPSMQYAKEVGPTPLGRYRVGTPHPNAHTGKYTMNLDPVGDTDTHGRTLLRIHGDNPSHMGQSSDGCIVLPLEARQRIWMSGDHEVEVVP